jgi:hypothetical protein
MLLIRMVRSAMGAWRTPAPVQVVSVLVAAAVLGGCQGDTLDPGPDIISGPVLTLAPQTVAVHVGPERELPLGGALRVTVAAATAGGAQGIARMGATALVVGPQGEVLSVMAIGDSAIESAGAGTVTRDFLLRPSALHVDALRLPDSVRYEVHGWTYATGGACAAAVKPEGQRLPCVDQGGVIVAHGERGTPFQVRVTAPHSVALHAAVPPRVEAHEAMTFVVTASAVPGVGPLAQVGVSARVRSETGPEVTLLLGSRNVTTTAAADTFRISFQQLVDLLPAGYPLPPAPNRLLHLDPSAFAVHASGACVAAHPGGTPAQLQCAPVDPAGRIAAEPAQAFTISGVEGRTVALPGGVAGIGDLLVHAGTRRLFASNVGGSTLEVLGIDNAAAGFVTRIPVGSRPWGLALNNAGDTVIVANSGGANVSFVTVGGLSEDRARRFEVPRVTLYDYIEDGNAIGLEFHNYADRPQYLAQDVHGRLLYSALSTTASPVGTIRLAEWRHGWRGWDSRLLFPCCLLATGPQPTNRAITASDNAIAIANVDSISMEMAQLGPYTGLTGNVIIWDHVPGTLPGDAGRLIETPALPINDAIMYAYNAGSDITAYPAHVWNVPESAAVAERTAVAASGDGRWVAIGEWPASQPGRLMMWSADDAALNRVEDIRDMLNNTADVISDVALNHDGSLGVARGDAGVYFFDRALRLLGTAGTALAGGRGVAFMPGSVPLQQQYVFAGSGRSTIQVLEPVHYRVMGEVAIRSNVTGALRVAACGAGAPADCLATVLAVTADGVVAVHVRNSHLVP